jgi:hypothetical protein
LQGTAVDRNRVHFCCELFPIHCALNWNNNMF